MARDIPKWRMQKIGELIVRRGLTIRAVAKEVGISKSSVYNHVKKMEELDPMLYKKVRRVLDYHLIVRHRRGGQATRKRYIQMKKEKTDEGKRTV